MEKDGLTELALLFKERETKESPSVTIGIVVNPPPNPRIRLNDVIVLEKENLVFASHLLKGYERNIKFTDADCGTTNFAGDTSHVHNIAELQVDTKMELTDTLKIGDEVILIPSVDQQLYYVIDKAVMF